MDHKLELVGIKIHNYRSFKEFPESKDMLSIGKYNVIVGKNDVGKSNIMRAIDIVLSNTQIYEEDLHKGKQDPCKITLTFSVPEELKTEIEEKLGYSGDDGILHITKEFKKGGGDNKKRSSITGKYYVQSSKSNTHIQYSKIKEYLPKVLYIPAIKEVDKELHLKKDTLISKLLLPIIEKKSEIDGKASKVGKLKEKLKKAIKSETEDIQKDIREELSKMWDDVEDVEIDVPDIHISKAFSPTISIKDKYCENGVDATNRGSGLQRHLILALLEVYRKYTVGSGYVLLLEEPEIYLHVGAQKRLCGILQDISKNGCVIITTHSNIFVDRSDLDHTYLLFKENGETKVRKPSGLKDVLDELGVTPSDVFLSDGIILVEGPSDAKILSIFAKYFFPKWDEYNISILPLGGANIEHHDPETLLQINPNIAIIMDADVNSSVSMLNQNKKKLKDKFEKAGIRVYFWTKDGKYVREIENLFSKDIIEETFGIEIPGNVNPYTNVPEKIENALRIENSNFKNQKSKIIKYHKTKHGVKIAKQMVERKKVPTDIKNILEDILKRFKVFTK